MKWVRKLWNRVCLAQTPFSVDEINDQTQALKAKVSEFATGLYDLATDEMINDLRSRIERLETELHPLKNGQPLRPPTYRT